MALEFGIVDLNAPGSTGTQNVTLSGFGVPDAVIAIRANSGGGWGTQASLSIGFWDGTTQACFSSNTVSGTSSTWSARGQSTSHIIALGTPTSESTQAITEYARVTGTTTDGVTLTWDVTSSAVLRYIFIKGVSSATVGVGSLTDSSTTTDVTVGHEPHVVFFTTVGDSAAPDNASTSKVQSFGVANYDGTNTNQFMVGYASQDNVSTSNLGNIFRDNACVGQTIWTGETWYGSFSRLSSTQFRLTTNTTAHGSDYFLYLALELTDPTEFAIGTDTTPSSATTDSVSGIGFEPAFLGIAMAGNTSANSASTTTNNRFCLGITDGATSHVAAEAEKDNNSSSSVANSYEADTLVSLPDGNGTSTLTHVGALSSFDSDGFTLSYSAANAAVYYGWFAVKAAGGGGVSQELTGNSSISAVGTLGVSAEANVSVTPTGVAGSSAVGTLGVTAEINASAELPGVAATSAVGTLTAEVGGGTTVALSGVAGTATVGTLTAAGQINEFVDLLGNSATGAVGTLIVVTGLQVALSGNAATGAVGTLGVTAEVNASAALTGVGSSGAVGTLEVTVPIAVSVELTGVGSTGAIGTLTAVGAGQVWTEIPPVSTIWTEIS